MKLTKLLLGTDPSAGVVKSTKHGFLLHYICQRNKPLALIDAFCKACPQACTVKDSQGNTPLHVMCEKGDNSPLQVILCLINGNPDAILVKDKDGTSVSFLFFYSICILLFLISFSLFCFFFSVFVGNTPLHSAVETLHKNVSAVANRMIDLRPKAAEVRDKQGNLALHSMCESSTPATDVIMKLIDSYPDGLGIKDKDGNLPLHSALERGDIIPISVLAKMIQVYPQACVIQDKEKNTCLHSACECRTKDLPKIVKLLLDADSKGVAAKTKDREGNLPVSTVVVGGGGVSSLL